MEIPPQDVIQDITRDIYNFLWGYKKIRINKITTTIPIKDDGLGILHIKTQCKAIRCAKISKFLRDTQNNKAWTEIMLWHQNRFRNPKQGVNLFKT